MVEKFNLDKHFENVSGDNRFWEAHGNNYENCLFSGCKFQKNSLEEIKFYDCRFENCDLSLVDVRKTLFRNIEFTGCRLSGVLFDQCNSFGLEVRFYDSKLDHSIFFGLKLTKAVFKGCSLKGVDFSYAQLKEADFDASDLMDARFDQTNLEKASLQFASNYLIHPEANNICGASFSLNGLPGLLAAYKIKVAF